MKPECTITLASILFFLVDAAVEVFVVLSELLVEENLLVGLGTLFSGNVSVSAGAADDFLVTLRAFLPRRFNSASIASSFSAKYNRG